MARCEDFPCCGHPAGDCPVYAPESGYLPYPCLGCGERIPVAEAAPRHASYCRSCLNDPRTFCEGPECPGCAGCMGDEDEDADCYDEDAGDDADTERAIDERIARRAG